jgi:hypothetical protein
VLAFTQPRTRSLKLHNLRLSPTLVQIREIFVRLGLVGKKRSRTQTFRFPTADPNNLPSSQASVMKRGHSGASPSPRRASSPPWSSMDAQAQPRLSGAALAARHLRRSTPAALPCGFEEEKATMTRSSMALPTDCELVDVIIASTTAC